MTRSSTFFEALAARPRRRLLVQLLDSDSVEVSEALRTRGRVEPAGAQGNQAQQQRIRDGSNLPPSDIQLYHVHLPKLDEYGFVEWDEETGVVSRGEQFSSIEPALRVVRDNASEFPIDLF